MCDPSAMQQVLDNLKELPPSTGAKDIDLIFLRGIMESPIVRSLAKVLAYWPFTDQFVPQLTSIIHMCIYDMAMMCYKNNIYIVRIS